MSQRSHKKNHHYVAILAAIAVIATVAGVVHMTTNGGQTISLTIGSNTQGQQNNGGVTFGNTQTGPQTYEGPTEWDTSGLDALENGISFVDDDYTATYYRKGDNGKYVRLASASDVSSNVNPARATIGILPTDTKLYMTIMPQDGGSSDTMYVAPEAIKQSNPRVLSYSFFNIDDDTDKEWVFELNAVNLKEIGRVTDKPNIPLTIFFDDYVTTFSVVTGGLVGAGTGTKLNTLRQTWTMSEDASAIAQIEYIVSLNQTSPTGFWNEGQSWIEVPNVGKKYFTEATRSGVEGSSYVYHFKLGTDLGSANLVTVADGADTTMNAYVYLTTEYDASSDGVQMTYTVNYITPSQSTSSASDCTKVTGTSVAVNC